VSVSNQVVKQFYSGTGAQVNFAIPFAFIPSDAANEVKVYLIDNTSKVVTLVTQGAGAAQYGLTPAYNAVTNPNGPTTVVFVTAPAATKKVLVTRALPITQIVDYINSGKFVAKSHEMGMDRMVFIIQQLNDALGRASQVSVADEARGFNPTIPPMPSYSATLRTNDTQTAFEWVPLDASGTAGAVPVGGGVGAALVKKTAADLDVEWNDFAIDGFSSRFGGLFSSVGLRDTIDKIIAITYTGPGVSLSASGSGTVREKGTAVTSVNLSATVTKRSNPIGSVVFKKDGATIYTVPAPNPLGGVENYTWTGSFTDNTTFSVEVTDTLVSGTGPTTASSSQAFTYVYPYFNGAGAVGLAVAAIQALTKSVIVSTATLVRTMTATAGQVFYFAYPQSYGVLTSILDVNNFETLPDWTRTTRSFTGLDGTPQNYYVYEFNNPVVAGSYQYTFKR
jgi:hypothetical protein